MKNVILKINVFILLFISCKYEPKIDNLTNNKKNDSLKDHGIYFRYPYKELYDVLRFSDNDSEKILLNKIITKNNLKYQLELNSYPFSSTSTFPFFREFQDYEPYLSSRLDNEIEKLYFTTPKNSFVVKLEYGTGHIRWNYLYEINNGIKLKDIFYTEPQKNYAVKSDTIMYLVRFKINKNLKDISFEKIKKINNDIDNSTKEEKWLTN